MPRMNSFLPNRANRRLFPGFVAFAVAAIGVALGFVAQWLSVKWLGMVAFFVVAIGVVFGFGAVVWLFITTPREIARQFGSSTSRDKDAF